jgi:hypothetical protein
LSLLKTSSAQKTDPVCGELVILTEDRAAAQTCGTIGEG